MCGYKCVAERSCLCVGIPLVFNMCVWVQGFSATAWFLSHISKMERQSYYTMESCLHGTAASMVRHSGPGYSLDRPVTKPGIRFMGQFCVGRDSVLIQLPLLLALMGYSKLPYSEHLNGCIKIKFCFCSVLWDWKRQWKRFFTAQGCKYTASSLNKKNLSDLWSKYRQQDNWLIRFTACSSSMHVEHPCPTIPKYTMLSLREAVQAHISELPL